MEPHRRRTEGTPRQSKKTEIPAAYKRFSQLVHFNTERRIPLFIVSRVFSLLSIMSAFALLLSALSFPELCSGERLSRMGDGLKEAKSPVCITSNLIDAQNSSSSSSDNSRYLAITQGVSLVLGLITTLSLMYGLRNRKLMRRQMDFIASMSHDLRTPLSVIGSAADNLAEGIVRSEHGVRDYGALIRTEGRRVSSMLEQILRFAAGKADYRTRNTQYIRIPDIIEDTLREAAASIEASGFYVEKRLDLDLPMFRADARDLSQCLLNFLSNGLKYGARSQWLRISTRPVETGRGTGVQITVEDRGFGIPSHELPYIFEPFYRGRDARSAQIRGTGLGLSLAQEAASRMGARITVESVPGEGSASTIHLPAAYMNSSTIPVEALVES
jgi:signal transduction histidine kinase